MSEAVGYVARDPVELLRALIRFDTSNPPGNERACQEWIAGVLEGAGIPSRFLARNPDRPNVVARIPGRGAAKPLLLYGHVDVATTIGQRWTRDPFSADLVDGVVWGRGALDMKGGLAIMLGAILELHAEGSQVAGDVVLAFTSDEEGGSELGAEFLVSEHADLFDGVRFAISEVGGFTQEIAGRIFYPIQVAEKTRCHLRATIEGPSGHGATPVRGGTTAKLAKLLRALDRKQLPVHITPAVQDMLEAMDTALPPPYRAALRALLAPRLTNSVTRALGNQAASLDALVRNTAAVVSVHGGDGGNVLPGLFTVEVDGRLLPGQTARDLTRELERLAPGMATWEVVREEHAVSTDIDLGLLPLLVESLKQADPKGTPFPLVVPGATDARFFKRLGIQTYGFLPMRLPPEISMELIHSADERIPVDAVSFGVRTLKDALTRYR
jgi:acetylornithine deacetylase/succinyl-diaminopimelate desuccinylase-like protein